MTDRKYMARAIRLAKKGEGFCHPNPMVGAVIVKDCEIIGEGWHKRYGDLHAERNALASLSGSAQGATMYVTLEPCCHWGKTPPCTLAIIQSGISKVVVGSSDPNPKVAGKGIAELRKAGIGVVEGFMKNECDSINPVFFKYITTGLPYVTMKWAMTLDGKTATCTGASKWITGPGSLREVHRMRHANMAIMVGIGTVLADNPLLNCRIKGGKNPVRVICDRHLRIPQDSMIVQTAKKYRTIVCCSENGCNDVSPGKEDFLKGMGVETLRVPNLKTLMSELGRLGIDSVLLEGGATLNASALEEGIVDEIRAFVAPKIFGGTGRWPVEGKGVNTPDSAVMFEVRSVRRTGDDVMIVCRPEAYAANTYRFQAKENAECSRE